MKNDIYKGWIVSAWKKEDGLKQIIKLQKSVIFILLLVTLLTISGWFTAPTRLTIYIPPDIQNGATLKPNTIPKPLIYSFAYEIWQELNYWPSDNGDDYEKNINTFWAYLTPQFKTELQSNIVTLRESGQLQRTRFLQGISGAAYEVENVKPLSNESWEVDLKMRLTEYKNGQIVKEVDILYPLRVTRINISQQNNPYGLALAGYVSEPQRQKTYI